MFKGLNIACISLIVLALVPFSVDAQATRSWKGCYTSYWHIATNWTGDAVPVAGDTAEIGVDGAQVYLASSATVDSLFLSNSCTLVFSNWSTCLNAVDVNLMSNSVVTCGGPFSTNSVSNRVYFAVNSFFLEAGAEINVDGKGFNGGAANGAGEGPGGGTYRGAGGGYGGYGGRGYDGLGGTPYCDKTAPTQPGSGSGGNGAQVGGPGGGAVRIAASGKVVINGIISSKGMPGGYCNTGAGSGGGVYITCGSFTGTNGLIAVRGGRPTDIGGAWNYGAGGGGGRIAIVGSAAPEYDRSVQLAAYPGIGGPITEAGYAGTVYVSDTAVFPTVWTNSSGGYISSATTNWSPSNLLVSCSILGVDDEFNLSVQGNAEFSSTNTVNQNGSQRYYYHRPNGLFLQPNSRFSCGGDLTMDNVHFHIYGSTNTGNTNMTSVRVSGDWNYSSQGRVYTFANGTNNVFPEYDILLDVDGSTVLGTNVWVYPYSHITNGGGALFRFGNLTVSSNAGFNANAERNNNFGNPVNWYYVGGYSGPRSGTAANGWGPGQGIASGGIYGGGGYGGAGAPVGVQGGVTYGSSNAPIQPGSGGAANAGAGGAGDSGGGIIRMEIDNVASLFQGSVLSANGQSSTYINHAGGSGGAIYLRCRQIIAEAGSFLSATGGTHRDASPANTYVGGGGRIAVWSTSNSFAGTTVVTGGTPGNGSFAEDGTVVMGMLPDVRANMTNFSMVVQSNRSENIEFQLWNASGTMPAYYSFASINVPPLVLAPSNGVLNVGQVCTVSLACVSGGSLTGVYSGLLRVAATNTTMIEMEPRYVDIAAEVEVVPPPHGVIFSIK